MIALARRPSIASILGFFALAAPLGAADNTWTNAAANFNWNTTDANWTAPAVWANGDSAIFGPVGIGTITVAPGIVTGSLDFAATGFTLTGGDITLATGTGGTLPDFTVRVGPASGTGSFSATIGSALVTAGGLTKVGIGSLTLTNSANVFSGSVPLATSGLSANVLIGSATDSTVLGGTLVIGNAAALPAAATVAIGNGALDVGSATVAIADLTFTNTTTLASFTTSGVFATGGGSFSVASNTINVIGLATGRGNTIGANLNLPATLDLRVGSSTAGNNELIFNGIISGPGGLILSPGVTDTGTQSQGGITIRRANTFAGGFTLNSTATAGVLVDVNSTGPANAPTSGAFGTGTLTIAAAGTLVSGLTSRIVGNPVAVQSDFTIAGSAGLVFTGDVDLNSTGAPLTRALTITGPATFRGVVGESSGVATTLQKLGTGSLTLSAANTYSGGTLLTAGAIGLGHDQALSSATLTVNGNSGLFATNGPRTVANPVAFDQSIPVVLALGNTANLTPLTLSGPIDLNIGATPGSTTFSVPAGMTATLSGALTHSGAAAGLTKTGAGTLILSGANSYDGPTAVSAGVLSLTGTNAGTGATTVASAGTVQFNGDASFASGPIGVTGTLQPLTSGTFTRSVASNGGMTVLVGAGLSPTFSGDLTPGTGAVFPFTKSGPGTLTLTATDTGGVTGNVSVSGGELILGGAAGNLVNASAYSVGNGARLTVDNTAGVADRLNNTGNVTLNGGEIRAIARATGTTNEAAGLLNVANGVNSVTGIVGGAGLSLTFAGYTPPAGASATTLFRGQNLGTPGGFSVRFTSGAPANGTLLARALGDNDPAGTGSFLVEYSTTNGVQQVSYTTGLLIQNAAPTLTPTTAHFQVAGAAATADAANTIASLTLAGANASVDAASGTLTLSSGQIVSQSPAGATDRSINGGVLQFGTGGTGASASFTVLRDLAVSSAIVADGGLVKNGAGRLTLSGSLAGLSGPLAVNGGTVAIANGAALTNVSGTGAVEIGGGGNLTLSSTANQAVALTLRGAGGFRFMPTGTFTATLTGANSYAGGTVAGPNARLSLRNPTAIGSGPVALQATSSSTFAVPLMGFDFGANSNTTIPNDVALPATAGITNVFAIANSNTNLNQAVTLTGRISGGNPSASLTFDESGTSHSHLFRLTNPQNDFQGTVRVISGGLAITSDAVLGNVDNDLQLNSPLPPQGTLRFEGNGITLPATRAIAIGGSISINTNGNDATIAGPLSGSVPMDKLGAGTLTLTNATQPYTGAVFVRAGTLAVNGSLASSTNTLTVNAGATLAGTGTISRPSFIDPDGIVSPGTSPGTLTINGALTMSGKLNIEAGDVLNVQGLYSNSFTSAVEFQGAFNPLTTYNFLTFSSYNNVPFGSVINLPATHFLAYGVNVISLVPVPEPTYVLLACAGATVLWRRRRNRR